jgi:hypothetical protein
LLDYADTTNFSKTHIAYILATAYHETNETMQPVKEAYWIKPESARVWALRKYYRKHPTIVYPDGRLFAGGGYVQLTHDYNYKNAGVLIGVGDELFLNPEKALIPEYAVKILFEGMRTGLFTGKKLSDFVTFYSMRHVVNGTDRAKLIEDYAKGFFNCII